MRLFLRIFALFFGIAGVGTSSFADPGWTPQSSGTPGYLLGVSFGDADHGIAVGVRIMGGPQAVIVYTTDGGDTWAAPPFFTPTGTIRGVFFGGPLSATVVGAESRSQNGAILVTGDGGRSWSLRYSARPPLNAVTFAGGHWTAVGAANVPPLLEAVILATGAGGWMRQSSGIFNSLSGVSFADANTGLAVGEHGTILRTTDGGGRWTVQESGTTAFLSGVSFMDVNTATVVGEAGTILRTTDGGDCWMLQLSGTKNSLGGVSFVDANTGWVVGVGGTILHTIDGGDNWTLQESGTTTYLSGVSFVDANTGWVVGTGGTILHTITGGE